MRSAFETHCPVVRSDLPPLCRILSSLPCGPVRSASRTMSLATRSGSCRAKAATTFTRAVSATG